jgi:hypothetical protein
MSSLVSCAGTGICAQEDFGKLKEEEFDVFQEGINATCDWLGV